ncbi:unnamed protein product [Acanthoscelides obtectus]|uniref:Cyclin-dependent kinase inhibitor domain-containing protein n=1 Tax=Acanthoscelides obtectus TaxID=200917 RepID=A0A9P0KFY9_ACAOB|nr:unnamed protein product [Acanthoscelides obtectus]CAK1631775.1 Cyclin-dependent kinase inhibitor 1B [Acanthoscelides obtectus]
MTTSIYKPLGVSLLSHSPDRMIFCRSDVRKVKRVLFEPVDHVSTQKFLEEELKKVTVTESEKWNFDFKKQKPLSGAYKWRTATPQMSNRPIKRRSSEDLEVEDLYPPQIIRPTPTRAVPTEESPMTISPSIEVKTFEKPHKAKPQLLITGCYSKGYRHVVTMELDKRGNVVLGIKGPIDIYQF